MNLDLTLILEIISFFLLLWLLKKFVFAKVLVIMDKRAGTIKDTLAEIERLREEAHANHLKVSQELLEIKQKALQIKNQTFLEVQQYRAQKMEAAQKESEEIIKKAKEDVAAVIEEAKQQVRSYAAEIAFAIAKKILEEEITPQKHKKIIEESLKEWQ